MQDPLPLPGTDALQYGANGIIYTMVIAFALVATAVGTLAIRVLGKIGKGIENAVEKQAAAIESQSKEQHETNTQLRLLIERSDNNTEKVLKQHETSTSIILERLERNGGQHGGRAG